MTSFRQSSRRMLVLSLGCSLAVVIAGGRHATGCEIELPPQARAMTGVELYLLYRDKSWLWPEGAGRMESQGRRFTAWSGKGEDASWAEGRWIVTDSGRFCLDATWHSSSAFARDTRICFSHRIHDGTIYQRKDPSGPWYVFRDPNSQEDEFGKLVGEDLVSAEMEKLKPALPAAAPPEA
jgi:hypothetical protein